MGRIQQNATEKHTQDRVISASEINKYVYCPLQWYYGRVYGDKYIRNIQREKNPSAGGEPKAFRRGRDFHENYMERETTQRAIRWTLFFVVLFIILAIIYTVLQFVY